MKDILESIYEVIIDGAVDNVPDLVQAALDQGIPPEKVLKESMIPAMSEVGRLFEINEYYVPEMFMSARAMQAGLNLLKPHLIEQDIQSNGVVVIGTVRGDMHEIGKNLVAIMLESVGFEVIDLGVDVKPDIFVESVRSNQPKVVAISGLLTTTLPNMKLVIDALWEAGVRDGVKVIVGGAPVSAAFAKQIGADGYAPDAAGAARLAQSLN